MVPPHAPIPATRTPRLQIDHPPLFMVHHRWAGGFAGLAALGFFSFLTFCSGFMVAKWMYHMSEISRIMPTRTTRRMVNRFGWSFCSATAWGVAPILANQSNWPILNLSFFLAGKVAGINGGRCISRAFQSFLLALYCFRPFFERSSGVSLD